MAVRPPLNSPLTDERGLVSDAWAGFFTALVSGASAVDLVTVGPSPFTYRPSAIGHALLDGGTSVSARIIRGRNSIVVPATGFIPISPGDSLVVTFAAPPSLRFFPE